MSMSLRCCCVTRSIICAAASGWVVGVAAIVYTRAVEQPRAGVGCGSGDRGGKHWVAPPADGARIAIGYQGPVVAGGSWPAFGELQAESLGRGCWRRSTRRIGRHAGWLAAMRSRREARTRGGVAYRKRACWRHWHRGAALVTVVLDGHPAILRMAGCGCVASVWCHWPGSLRTERGLFRICIGNTGLMQDAILDGCAVQALLSGRMCRWGNQVGWRQRRRHGLCVHCHRRAALEGRGEAIFDPGGQPGRDG